MKRILYVEPTGEIGGSGISLLSLLQHMDRYASVVVVPREGALATRLRQIQIPVHLLPMPQGDRRSPVPWGWSVLRLAILCRYLRVNLVHGNHEFANRYASITARLAGIPQICHVRNIQTADSFRHYWLRLAPILVANSKATQQSYLKQMPTGQQSLVIYNGVDLSQFDGRRTRREKLGFGHDQFVIAQVGRLVPDKGMHIFVRAMASLTVHHSNVYALIVGDTSVDGDDFYVAETKQLISQLQLTDRFVFTGYVSDIHNVYSAIDLLVQPSTHEGFGRTVLEAMAMRVPVISTNVGGPREIIEDGVSGLLIPPNDSDALAEAIDHVIKDRSLAIRLAHNGRSRAQEHFSLDRQVAQIQTLYDEIVTQESLSGNSGV